MKGYAKFWRANKVYCGRCDVQMANGEINPEIVDTVIRLKI